MGRNGKEWRRETKETNCYQYHQHSSSLHPSKLSPFLSCPSDTESPPIYVFAGYNGVNEPSALLFCRRPRFSRFPCLLLLFWGNFYIPMHIHVNFYISIYVHIVYRYKFEVKSRNIIHISFFKNCIYHNYRNNNYRKQSFFVLKLKKKISNKCKRCSYFLFTNLYLSCLAKRML